MNKSRKKENITHASTHLKWMSNGMFLTKKEFKLNSLLLHNNRKEIEKRERLEMVEAVSIFGLIVPLCVSFRGFPLYCMPSQKHGTFNVCNTQNQSKIHQSK